MTLVYSDGDGAAKHFTGTGTATAFDVELDSGRKIQLVVTFDIEV